MIAAMVGDTHGNLKEMWRMALGWQEQTGSELDFIFQVGDFGVFPDEERLDHPSRKYAERHGQSIESAVGDFPYLLTGEVTVPVPTYFIRGNHEDQKFLLDLEREAGSYRLRHPIEVVPNLFYVPDGCIFEVEGLRIAGWGGAWGAKTWEMGYWSAERLNSPRRLNHLTRDVFERLIRQRFDVLVTHDGPTGIGLRGALHGEKNLPSEELTTTSEEGGGVPYIRELIETSGCQYSFSGHWHEPHQVRVGGSNHYSLDKVHAEGDNSKAMVVIEL